VRIAVRISLFRYVELAQDVRGRHGPGLRRRSRAVGDSRFWRPRASGQNLGSARVMAQEPYRGSCLVSGARVCGERSRPRPSRRVARAHATSGRGRAVAIACASASGRARLHTRGARGGEGASTSASEVGRRAAGDRADPTSGRPRQGSGGRAAQRARALPASAARAAVAVRGYGRSAAARRALFRARPRREVTSPPSWRGGSARESACARRPFAQSWTRSGRLRAVRVRALEATVTAPAGRSSGAPTVEFREEGAVDRHVPVEGSVSRAASDRARRRRTPAGGASSAA
jgi:hypothetical protein